MADDDLVVRAELLDHVSGPARRAEASVDRLAASARRAGDGAKTGSSGLLSMATAGDRLTQMASRADKTLIGWSNTLGDKVAKGAKYAAVGLAAASVAAVGFGLKTAAGFEQSRVAFGTLLGSVEKGNALFDQLRAFNVKTPFDLPQITRTTQVLMGMGFATESLIPTLTAASDVASGLGVGEEGLGRIALNLGQIKTQGRATGREIRDLAVLGVPSYALMADILGVTTEQVRAMGDEAVVTGDQFIDAFVRMQGPMAKFAGASVAQSKTLTGVWSNFKDTIAVGMADAFDKSGAGAQLVALAPGLATSLGALGASVVRVFGALLPVVTPVLTATGTGLTRLIDAAGGSTALTKLGTTLGDSVGQLVTSLVPLMPELVDLFVSLVGILPGAVDALSAMIPLVTPVAGLATALLSWGPAPQIFGTLLVVLLGYSRLNSAITAIRGFGSALGFMAAQQTAVNVANAGAGVGGVGGAAGAAGPVAGGAGGGASKLGAVAKGATSVFLMYTAGKAAADWVGDALDLRKRAAGIRGFLGAEPDKPTPALPPGDTARPWAGSGIPGLLAGAGMGGLTVTSGQRNWGLGGLGSDHATGRAVDLIGPNLNAYRASVERMGGFAEFHGDGAARHLHAVGDTPRPRPSGLGAMGGDAPIVVNFHGDLIVNSDVDLESALRAGIAKARQDERERGKRGA